MQYLAAFIYTASRMRTAVLLLAVLAVASLAGTFLEQGLPQATYTDRIGPFWFSVFNVLGLFNVYAAPWFLAIGAVLAFSVTCCVWQNGPTILAMAKRPKKVPLQGVLKNWPVYKTYPAGRLTEVTEALSAIGYKHTFTSESGWQYYRTGVANRWGYFFTHIGVLVLCVAGLVSATAGWRGITNLAHGESYSATWVSEDGKRVSKALPFTLRNNGFGIDFYQTGMPSSFYTDISVLEGDKVVKEMEIAVNEPLFYQGYAIYQASFGDAGSDINFRLRRLRDDATATEALTARVRETVRNDTSGETVELVDFRPNTVEPIYYTEDQKNPSFTDVGPSVDYILRVPDKAPLQLRSYMQHPHLVGLGDGEGNYTPTPIGLNPAIDEGWPMLADLRRSYAAAKATQTDVDTLDLMKGVASRHLSGKPEGERFALAARVLQAAQVLEQTDLPAVLILDSFNHRMYTGLQVAYDPGADIFWLGSILLVLGATLMSLFGFGRVWIHHKGDTLTLAGQSGRAGILTALKEGLPSQEDEHAA